MFSIAFPGLTYALKLLGNAPALGARALFEHFGAFFCFGESLPENGFQNQQSILVCRWASKKETYETHRLNKRRSGIPRFMMGVVRQGLRKQKRLE